MSINIDQIYFLMAGWISFASEFVLLILAYEFITLIYHYSFSIWYILILCMFFTRAAGQNSFPRLANLEHLERNHLPQWKVSWSISPPPLLIGVMGQYHGAKTFVDFLSLWVFVLFLGKCDFSFFQHLSIAYLMILDILGDSQSQL